MRIKGVRFLFGGLIVLAFIILSSCGGSDTEKRESYQYQKPEQLTDGIQTGYLDEVGMDSEMIFEFVEDILNGYFNTVHSVLIYRRGLFVLEEYFEGYRRDQKHMIASCTKSVASALVGISIDKGYIGGIETRMFEFFPDYADLNDTQKDRIMLVHMLTMTTGLEWDESSTSWQNNPLNTLYQMYQSDDWSAFVLSRPVAHPPGEVYAYNTGCSFLFSGVIKHATGVHAHEFANLFLFDPLGIDDVEWDMYHELPHTGGGLHMRPRDMLKFGILFLHRGVWQGRQIISEQWVNESTTKKIQISDTIGYAYQWRDRIFKARGQEFRAFSAQGFRGQYILVFPELEMVVVFTQWHISSSQDRTTTMLESHIIPAVLED